MPARRACSYAAGTPAGVSRRARAMTRFLLICLGGAAGTGARYLVGGWAAVTFGATFPVGTLLVNLAGSFALSVVMHLGLTAGVLPPDVRVILATGVMGGFTTYSSFNYEVLGYLEQGAWLLALVYLGATVVGCLAAGLAGLALGRALVGG